MIDNEQKETILKSIFSLRENLLKTRLENAFYIAKNDLKEFSNDDECVKYYRNLFTQIIAEFLAEQIKDNNI